VAVRLRLRRIGKKKMPAYQIVAADSRVARDGKFLEVVGRYEPLQKDLGIQTRDERVIHWLRKGALPTDTVRALFRRTGLWMRWSLTKQGKDDSFVTAMMEQWQAGQADKRSRETARKARRTAAKKKAKTAGTAAPAPAAEAPAAS
jgi:small subunit ribosomal protein S16